MIRILVAIPLSPKVMDQLNEITEFEIIDRTGPGPEPWLDEIRNADALIFGGSPPVTEKLLAAGSHLRLVITCGGRASRDREAAERKHIELRRITAGRACGSKAVAILKEFFNV